jgi:hypothetical protein
VRTRAPRRYSPPAAQAAAVLDRRWKMDQEKPSAREMHSWQTQSNNVILYFKKKKKKKKKKKTANSPWAANK